jgi:Uncharacterized protein conserved in bacteria
MENNNRDQRSSALSVGKRLKEAREKKSLSIEQVQKQTKIHYTVLIGLEEGKPSDTLTDTYIRSFLKQYAHFLGLNSAELLKDYFPANTESPAPSIPIPVPEKISSQEVKSPSNFIYMAVLATVAIISIMLIIFIVNQASAILKKTKPAQQKRSLAASAKKKPAAKIAPAAQKKKPVVSAAPETKDIVPKSEPLILEIKVKKAVRVKLKKDGALLWDRLLPAGTIERAAANKSIELDIAKAEDLSLSLNDQPIVLEEKGVLKGLEITRKGVKTK